jgi:17-hydroxy-3-oxo-4-pregnene-20-carboxyl-CoA lyase
VRLSGRTAIAGIGATEFSKDSGRSELRLAAEAVKAALDDAGLDPSEVDGLTTFTMDANEEIEVARTLGMGDLSFFSRIHYGGGAACAVVHQAAMAVATGAADVVVAYRALNGRSRNRFGASAAEKAAGLLVHYSWYFPYGLLTPASWVAMFAQRYMHEYGATEDDLGRVSVACREFAATNPAAWFYQQPITLEDHHASRWIVEPLRLLDCCQESDGGVAVVVTSAERARDLRQPPVVIEAASQGAGADQEEMTSYSRDDIAALPEAKVVADRLWAESGLQPSDVQTAVIYDPFTPFVLLQLEEFGFCGRGESKDFVREVGIGPGGRFPVNTNGGQLGEAYIHGMNGVAEGVRQVRGTAANQVDDVDHVLVTAGVGVPTSGLILGAA